MENRLFYAPLPEDSMIQLAHKSPITNFSPLIILFNLTVDTDMNVLRCNEWQLTMLTMSGRSPSRVNKDKQF